MSLELMVALVPIVILKGCAIALNIALNIALSKETGYVGC